jgi:hypothetical protein
MARSASFCNSREMKALTWKAVFASLNPSPVFEVVAIVAEGLAMNADESRSKETEGADDGRRRF